MRRVQEQKKQMKGEADESSSRAEVEADETNTRAATAKAATQW